MYVHVHVNLHKHLPIKDLVRRLNTLSASNSIRLITFMKKEGTSSKLDDEKLVQGITRKI